MLFKKGDIISPIFKVREEHSGSYRDKKILMVITPVEMYSVQNLDDDELVEDLSREYIESYYELKPGLKKFTKLRGLYE